MTVRDRRRLVIEAAMRAYSVRSDAGLTLDVPLCVFDLATGMGLDVWFKATPRMEGMYCKDPGPSIVVSSLRPAGRQAYTGGHELGHHVFGHGTRVDELLGEGGRGSDQEEELLADCFAGFLLMPKAAVVRGFSCRGWNSATVMPDQVFTVAGWLGVGYDALITHMQANLGLVDGRRAAALRKDTPKKIKSRLLGLDCTEELIIADRHWEGRAIDLQVGDAIMTMPGVAIEHPGLAAATANLFNPVLRGTAPGTGRIHDPASGWAAFVRVSRRGYVGRARFRHLEEADDDESVDH